jgi:DNA-binding CsgD family transcriptional regulator
MQLSMDKYNELIEIIYQIAIEPNAFQWLLDFLNENTHFHGSSIAVHDTQTLETINRICGGVTQDALFQQEHKKLYGSEDIWAIGLMKCPYQGQFIPDHLLIARNTFEQSTLKKFLQPYDVYSATGAHWNLANNKTVRISFQKNTTGGYVTESELCFLNLLTNHISRALTINQKLQVNEDKTSLLKHIERNQQCVALISLRGDMYCSNIVFENFIEKMEAISMHNGRLRFKELHTQQTFEKYLLQTKFLFSKSKVKQSFILASNDNDADFQCVMTPLINQTSHFDVSEPIKILLTIEPISIRISDKSSKIIQETHVSPAELDICLHLARGLSIKDISNIKVRSEQTVRTQVKSIQRKFGVNSQAGIVSKILTF